MKELILTHHAATQMAQRGIALRDANLIARLGTEDDNGYLVRTKDCQAAERAIKKFLDRIRRLRGKRLVVSKGRIVTAFHALRQQTRHLLRDAYEQTPAWTSRSAPSRYEFSQPAYKLRYVPHGA
jgi:hypothetical protein